MTLCRQRRLEIALLKKKKQNFKYSYDISNAAAAHIKSGLKFKSAWTMHIIKYCIVC